MPHHAVLIVNQNAISHMRVLILNQNASRSRSRSRYIYAYSRMRTREQQGHNSPGQLLEARPLHSNPVQYSAAPPAVAVSPPNIPANSIYSVNGFSTVGSGTKSSVTVVPRAENHAAILQSSFVLQSPDMRVEDLDSGLRSSPGARMYVV